MNLILEPTEPGSNHSFTFNHMKKPLIKTGILLFALSSFAALGFSFLSAQDELSWLDKYNILWNTQSRDASESMPVGGGDTGCNLWVEDGELLFYVQRSGSMSENGEYLKMGRIRIKLAPNPFENPSSFRQELILKDGYVEIEGSGINNSPQAKIKVWVEVNKPVIHVDIDTDKPVEVTAAYESWRRKTGNSVTMNPGNVLGASALKDIPERS